MIPEADGRPLPPIDSVWVIEAPGKISCMESILTELGYAPQIIATKGHFMKMPNSLALCGIDANFSEHMRHANPEVVERLQFHIRRLPADGQVFIATDADTEGDVIATDILDTISGYYPNPLRVRLRALDPESFSDALRDAEPIRREDATAGRTRAIIDRAIGAGFAARGIAAGRIRSAILGLAAKSPPPTEWLHLTAPAGDDGRDWFVSFPVKSPLSPQDADLLADVSFPPLTEACRVVSTPEPDDMGRILVRAGDELDMSPKEAARAMQSAYESGRLSYPRSDARGISEHAASRLSSSFRKNGQNFQRNVVKIRTAADVHDSPWPIGPVNPALDPLAMGAPEAVRTMISQSLLRSGAASRIGQHEHGTIRDFLIDKGFSVEVAEMIDNQAWSREIGPRKPGPSRKSGLVRRRPDTALLEACVEAGIGRPSTYATHIENMLESGLIDHNLNLTDSGKRLVAVTPDALLDPEFSRTVEKACHAPPPRIDGAEPWQALASQIISSLPDEVGTVVMAAVRSSPAQTVQKPAVSRSPANTVRVEASRTPDLTR